MESVRTSARRPTSSLRRRQTRANVYRGPERLGWRTRGLVLFLPPQGKAGTPPQREMTRLPLAPTVAPRSPVKPAPDQLSPNARNALERTDLSREQRGWPVGQLASSVKLGSGSEDAIQWVQEEL